MPLPLKPVLFNNTSDIDSFAQRLIKFSLNEEHKNALYQQLIVSTNGDTFFLEDILNLTDEEVAGLVANKQISFWLRTPETIKNKSAPKLISLTELKKLDLPRYSELTFNRSLIDTLRPHLEKVQAKHWLDVLANKAGRNVEDIIAAPEFARQWIKATNGQIFYLPQFQGEFDFFPDLEKEKISFKVNYKDPNANESIVKTLSKAELKKLSKEEWGYLEFEYDEAFPKKILDINIANVFKEKLNCYQVDNNDPNLARHLLVAVDGNTYLLEEILKPDEFDNSKTGLRFRLNTTCTPLKDIRNKLLYNVRQFPGALPKDIEGKEYDEEALQNQANDAKLFEYNPNVSKKQKFKKLWSIEEIRNLSAAEQLSYYYFKFNKNLAELISDKIAINCMDPDPSHKEAIFLPTIAYSGHIYDKYSIRCHLNISKVAPDTAEYLTLRQVADDWALQSLLKLAYAGNLSFTEKVYNEKPYIEKAKTKDSIKKSLDMAKGNLLQVKNILGNNLSAASAWIERAKKKYSNATPQKTLAWLKRLNAINKVREAILGGSAISILLTALCSAVFLVFVIVSSFVPGLAGVILAWIALGALCGGGGCFAMSLLLAGISWLMKKIWPLDVTNNDINLLKNYDLLIDNHQAVLDDEKYFQELESIISPKKENKEENKELQVDGLAPDEALVSKAVLTQAKSISNESSHTTTSQIIDSETSASSYKPVTSASNRLLEGNSAENTLQPINSQEESSASVGQEARGSNSSIPECVN